MNLKSRIFDCFPAGQYGLVKLLRLVDVVETDAIPSAAIECSENVSLLINPAFVERHANTPEKLFTLVLHELYHVLLGHTQLFKAVTALDNFVFDCVINALICRQFSDKRYTSLFTGFYEADEFPTCFLRPPENWTPGQPALLPAVLKGRFKGAEQARRIYRALYSSDGATYADLYSLFPAVLGELQGRAWGLNPLKTAKLEDIDLLGGHANGEPDPGNAVLRDNLHASLKNHVREWPGQPCPVKGQSLGDILQEKSIKVARATTNCDRLVQLINSVAKPGAVKSDRLHRGQATVQLQTPIRPAATSRRELVQQSLGFTPLLYQGEASFTENRLGNDRVHVYLDVSGSMDGVLRALYAAVLAVGDKVHPRIHLFSTQVHDINLSQLRAGKVRSTGGTDINCVARHMEKNRVRNALLVTDGFVGRLTSAHAALLSRVKLAVAYTPGSTTEHLAAVTNDCAYLVLPGLA